LTFNHEKFFKFWLYDFAPDERTTLMTLNMDLSQSLVGKHARMIYTHKILTTRKMNLISVSSIIALAIPILVYLLAWILAYRSFYSREKSASFECGFDPSNRARIPFSMRFFLLAIIFIVFDIEIVLLTPIPIIIPLLNPIFLILIVIFFLVILLLGLLHEWNEGALDWSL
jgi:NADH-ubiquinone oxidoreductase chain 3